MERKELDKSCKIIRLLRSNGASDILVNEIFAFLVEKEALSKETATEMLLNSKITPDFTLENISKGIDEFYEKEVLLPGRERMKEIIDEIFFKLGMLGISKEKMNDKKWLKEAVIFEDGETGDGDDPITNEDEILEWVTFIIEKEKLKYFESSSIFLSAFERGDISKNQCSLFLKAVAEYDGFEEFNYDKQFRIANLLAKLEMSRYNEEKTNVILDIMVLLYREKLIEYDCLLGIFLEYWVSPFV